MRTPRQAILFVVAVTLAGCNASSTSTVAQSKAATVNTLPVQPRDVKAERRDIVGYDVVRANLYVPQEAQAAVLPPYQAPVEKVFVTVGKRVRKGEPLMQLSFPSAEASYQQSAQTLKQAQAAYSEANSRYGGALRAAQAQLTQARSAEISARSGAANTGDNAALNDASTARQTAESAVQQAQIDFRNNMAPFAQQLESAQQSFKEARAGAKMASVRAPISGTVMALSAVAGEQIGNNAQQPIAQIVNLDMIRVVAGLDDVDALKVKPGMPVLLTFQQIPNKQYTGRVVQVTTAAVKERTQGTTVKWQCVIDFSNAEGLVKPGVTVQTCAIQNGRVRNALAVPSEAVAKDRTGKPYVNLLDGQNWKPVVVETGLSDGKFTQIKSDLVHEGDTLQAPPQTPPASQG
jgi:HlyD family secretion protein